MLAIALSEGLRSKVLDLLFGAEEEFDYSSTTTPADAGAGEPVAAERIARERGSHGAPPWTSTTRRGVAAEADARGRAAAPARSLSGEKAQRIVDAMRRSVARRGTAGSTFDHVSREAGVSRGLLHYYFGTKEQLLVEAVRRDCELRLERLERQLSTAQTADDFIELMAQNLQETVARTRTSSRSCSSCSRFRGATPTSRPSTPI